MKKRTIIIPLVLVLAGGAGAGGWYYYNNIGNSDSENAVFADNVGQILGIVSIDGGNNRFSGVVEPQKTESIQLASGLKVKQTFVSVGDEVNVGDKLFEYDTDDAQDSITQLEIDIENADITIDSAKHQVEELEKLRDKAAESDKLSYTTQIMTTENSIKRSEYEKKSKQAEMEALKKQIANAVVYSQFQGIIKSINSSSGGSDDSTTGSLDSDESSSAYMTIMSTGEYRVKGTVNEQNMSQIQLGTPVLVYSRVDESQYWTGTISSIDKEHATSNSSSYFSSDDSMNNSSTYPFYVELESSEDLMLGQHVYVVQDIGQENASGMWLEDYYFIPDEEGNPSASVWVADENDKLEKRELTIGEYNEELASYEILSGLTAEDYIAFPDDSYEEGMSVTKNEEITYEASDDYSDDFYEDYGDDTFTDEEYFSDDEEYYEDDSVVNIDDIEILDEDSDDTDGGGSILRRNNDDAEEEEEEDLEFSEDEDVIDMGAN